MRVRLRLRLRLRLRARARVRVRVRVRALTLTLTLTLTRALPTGRARRVPARRGAELTRTPRGLRWVRTRYACQPRALGTYRRRRAACLQGPTYCTYRVRVPASAVPYVPRTVAPQAGSACTIRTYRVPWLSPQAGSDCSRCDNFWHGRTAFPPPCDGCEGSAHERAIRDVVKIPAHLKPGK